MATRKNSRFTPVFEGQTIRARVLGMQSNVVTVAFSKMKGNASRAAAAAKQARLV